MTYTTPVGSRVIELTPGPALDEGTITAGPSLSAPGNLTPLSYSNVGQPGNLTFASAGGRQDRLIVNGTSAAEAFDVDSTGRIRYGKLTTGGGFVPTKTVQTPGIDALDFAGHGGADFFGVLQATPFSFAGLGVNGDGDDELFYQAAAGESTVVDLRSSFINRPGGTMKYYGIAHISVDASGGPLTVSDTNGDDVIHYTPKSLPFFAGNGGTVAIDGLATTVDFNDATSDFTIAAAFGVDTLIVHATAGNDVVNVTRGAAGTTVQVNALKDGHPERRGSPRRRRQDRRRRPERGRGRRRAD